MAKKYIPLIVCQILLLSVLSCSEEIKPVPYTYTRVFTGEVSKTWDLGRLVIKETGRAEQEAGIDPCGGDDRYIFYANTERLFEVKNGRSACDPEDSGLVEDDLLVSYLWEYNSASATLSMVLPHIFGNFFVPFTVKEANKDSMVLELFLNEENTSSYVFYFNAVEEN